VEAQYQHVVEEPRASLAKMITRAFGETIEVGHGP
jgi:hypothetical protein